MTIYKSLYYWVFGVDIGHRSGIETLPLPAIISSMSEWNSPGHKRYDTNKVRRWCRVLRVSRYQYADLQFAPTRWICNKRLLFSCCFWKCQLSPKFEKLLFLILSFRTNCSFFLRKIGYKNLFKSLFNHII